MLKNILKRVCTGFLALATVITTLPATTAHAAEKQYWTESAERVGIIEQVVVWQRLSVHLGWQCDNVRAAYSEIPKATQDEVFSGARAFTDGNGIYSVAGATYGVFADKDCTKQLATLTTDENGNTDVVEVTAGTVYIKELSAPAGYKVDKTIYPLTIKAGEYKKCRSIKKQTVRSYQRKDRRKNEIKTGVTIGKSVPFSTCGNAVFRCACER